MNFFQKFIEAVRKMITFERQLTKYSQLIYTIMTYEIEQFKEKGNLNTYDRRKCSKSTYYRKLKEGWKKYKIYGGWGQIKGYIASNLE